MHSLMMLHKDIDFCVSAGSGSFCRRCTGACSLSHAGAATLSCWDSLDSTAGAAAGVIADRGEEAER
jgi:hypothetical protein